MPHHYDMLFDDDNNTIHGCSSRQSIEDSETNHESDRMLEPEHIVQKSNRFYPVIRTREWLSFQKFDVCLYLVLVIVVVLLALNLVMWTRLLHDMDQQQKNLNFERHFGTDLRYQSLDHAYDYLWDSSRVESAGLVFIPNDQGYKDVGAVSMFHQLHCLASFRTALQNAREGKDIGRDWREDGHWPHCFDYMRQAILCGADDTLERPDIINGTISHTISGTSDTRQCGDSQRLYDMVDTYGLSKL